MCVAIQYDTSIIIRVHVCHSMHAVVTLYRHGSYIGRLCTHACLAMHDKRAEYT